MYNFSFLLFFFLLNLSTVNGQFEKTESAPPNIDWYRIVSNNFKVYFPKELDSIANYTVSFLENNIDRLKINSRDKIRSSKIILHNQNSIPNAFVTSNPRRSEFYVNAKTESPHFLHNNNWIDLLATHEYRHLVQREVGYNSTFNKIVHYLFGESLSSMLGRSTAPNWYWEGDAVYKETTIDKFGRGRIPKFTLTSQMNLDSNHKIKYERQTLGSYKLKTPNEYETGYLMVKYLNEKFGEDTFNKIVYKANSQSFLPLPFYRAVKRETGEKYKTIYSKSLNTLPKKSDFKTSSPINRRKGESFSSFIYPTVTGPGNVIVIREGYGSYQDFRLIDKNGNEQLLFTPGLINDFGRIPYANNKIAWLEFQKDPRWDKRVYSSVKVLDLETRKLDKKQLKGFFSSIDLSPDGTKFVLSQNNMDGSQSFHIYNLKSFNKVKEHKFNSGVISSLKYNNDKELIGIETKLGIKSVFLFDLETNTRKIIFTTKRNIGWPSYKNHTILFSCEYNGFEEIFLYDIKSKKTFIVSNHKLGSYYPVFSKENENIYYSSMGNLGFDIYKNDTKNEIDLEWGFEEEIKSSIENKKSKEDFVIQKSNRFFEMILPTSWGISDYGFSEKGLDQITLGLESRSLFGDLLFGGGYKFDIRDKKNSKYFNLSYQGLYPIIDFSISSSNDSFTQDIVIKNQEEYDTIKNADIFFKTRDFSTSIRVPLSFTNGKYFTSFLGSVGYSYEKFKDFYTTSIGSESIKFPLLTSRNTRTYLSSLVLYSRSHKKSKRQVHSPYEQTILMEGKKTLSSSDYSGSYIRTDVYLAFPGIKNTHSTRVKMRAESQNKADYLFRDNINFIAGYQNNFNFNNFYGWGLEYELPILYPDLAFGPIAYIQRVRGTGFINNGVVNGFNVISSNIRETPTSLGVEITLDLNLFRQAFIFELGLKYAHVMGVSGPSQGNNFEISLGSIAF